MTTSAMPAPSTACVRPMAPFQRDHGSRGAAARGPVVGKGRWIRGVKHVLLGVSMQPEEQRMREALGGGALDMTGRAVIVTGGCKGIGRAVACRFLDAGASVIVCCRH